MKNTIVDQVFRSPKELLKLSVPSVVYAIQNNMAFIGLSNLDAAVYQVSIVTCNIPLISNTILEMLILLESSGSFPQIELLHIATVIFPEYIKLVLKISSDR